MKGVIGNAEMVKKKSKKKNVERNYLVVGTIVVVAVLILSYSDPTALKNNIAGKAVGGESGIIGSLDRVDADIISGWALDRDDPAKSVRVWVYIDDELVSSDFTDEYRGDIASEVDGSHSNSGYYMFVKYLNLPVGLHTVRAYGYSEAYAITLNGRRGVLDELVGSPKYLTIDNNKPVGLVEVFGKNKIRGWAFDVDNLNSPLRMRVVTTGGRVLGLSDQSRDYRADVADLMGISDVNTGFTVKDLTLHSQFGVYVEAYDAETSEWVKINKRPVFVDDSYT